jgi:cytochrome c oxidase subunit IV
LTIGVLSLKISKYIESIWFRIAIIFSKIIPNVLLSIIFYLILTPLAFLSKIFTQKKNNNFYNKDSFYIIKNKSFKKSSFERTW